MNIVQKTLLNLALKTAGVVSGSSFSTQFFGFDGGFSFSGLLKDNKLVNEGYASNTDVYAIIRLIVQKAGTVPFKLYIKTSDGKEEVTSGALYDLLLKPNESQTQKQFRENVLVYSLLTGDRFYDMKKNPYLDDTVREMIVLPSNLTDVVVNANNDVVGYQERLLNGVKKYAAEDVYHGKYFNPTAKGIYSHRGLSPLQAGYRSLQASNQSITARASFYKNRGKIGVLSSGTDDVLTDKQKKDLQEVFDKDTGGAEKVNGVHLSRANVKFTQLGSSPQDLEMFKSVAVDLQALCRLYGLDSKLLGDPKASTHNNIIQAEKTFWTNAALPANQVILDDWAAFLLPGWSEEDGVEYFIEQDTSGIEALQSNKKEEAEKNKIVVDGINAILTAETSDAAKVAMLVELYGKTEEEARALIS
jgi:HK97 family phage portal protein